MTTTHTDIHTSAIADVTLELGRLLKAGSPAQQLMRLYALRELVSQLSPELLLKVAADFKKYFPKSDREAA